MRVLITGASGFLGKNLRLFLSERNDVQIVCFTRDDKAEQLLDMLDGVDFVFHLAGINRPKDQEEFKTGNVQLTRSLALAVCAVAESTGKKVPIVYASSSQAAQDNPYGVSKRKAEETLQSIRSSHGIPVHVFRLPNVFGKWCKPNYNSAVATFCHNIANDLPIQVNEAAAQVTLVYIDDLIEQFVQLMDGEAPTANEAGFLAVLPQYTISVGELAKQIRSFKESRITLITDRVGVGLVRALYSTYVSYLPNKAFAYSVPGHQDTRGIFVEMLKTRDSGQFSFFTAHPGITRGGHYHNTKTEKFLVIKGRAQFRFRHMQSGETHELSTTSDQFEIVETVPGWTHDITNVGDEDLIVMLWANEIFDRTKPDTFYSPL